MSRVNFEPLEVYRTTNAGKSEQRIIEQRLSISKILNDKIRHQRLHVVELARSVDLMAGPRVEHELEIFVCLLECIDELHRVLEMDVVIHRTVDDEKLSVKVSGGFQHGAPAVALGVFGGHTHVAFRVNRVVECPVGHRERRRFPS